MEEYRNKGIGISIINSILESNITVYLWVYVDNVKAISLYEKLGFKIKEKNKDKYLMLKD